MKAPRGIDRELLRDPYGILERIASGETAEADARAEIARSGPSIGLPQDVFDVARSSQPEVLGDRSVSSAPPVAAIVPVLAGSPEIAGPLQRRIMQALSSLPPSSVPDVEVRDLKTEIMISLTDRYDTGMFAVASPRPTKELVAVMDRIAPILAETEGAVTIRGHTDGRMFRSTDNDNWRLSMARAQMAHFMLLRGGLPERRVKRLEGHADQSLKVPNDPYAAQNRRIEILIAK